MAVVLLVRLRRTQVVISGSSSWGMIGLAVAVRAVWSSCLRWRRLLAYVLVLWPAVTTFHGVKVSRLHLRPQRARDLSVTDFTKGVLPSGPIVCTVVVPAFLIMADDVVLSVLDGFRAQSVVEVVVPTILLSPLTHGFKHVLLDLNVFIADGWVVKGAENVIDDFINWHACMLPGVQHATGQVC